MTKSLLTFSVLALCLALAAVFLTSIYISVNTVFSVFSLIVVFMIATVSLVVMDFEFLAIIVTTIYVGAVSVFFIFVLMTINLRFEDSIEYFDEIRLDRTFSFLVLGVFSAFLQSIFYVEFREVNNL